MPNKLKSSDGASLAVALLLFLVCGVVGTVVLTAATAVGGRLAAGGQAGGDGRLTDLADLDQRYYSVASAVSLLAGELDGQSVTIERKKIVTTTTVTDYEHPENSTPPEDVVTYQTKIANDEPFEGGGASIELGKAGMILNGKSFLTSMAINLLFGDSRDGEEKIYCNTQEAFERYAFSSSDDMRGPDYAFGTFNLAHSSNSTGITGNDISNLNAECTYNLKRDGTLTIDVKDELQLHDLGNYTLTLTLSPVFQETPLQAPMKSSPHEISREENGDGTRVTVVTETTYTLKSTVTWNVVSVG